MHSTFGFYTTCTIFLSIKLFDSIYRQGSVYCDAAVDVSRSGATEAAIEKEMKNDVTDIVKGIAEAGEGGGFVFNTEYYMIRDPKKSKDS